MLLTDHFKYQSPPQLIWSETTPQHFPLEVNGYYKDKNRASYMKMKSAMSEHHYNELDVCPSYIDNKLAYSKDWRNRDTYQVLRSFHHVGVLKLWTYLQNYSFAHVIKARSADCTHWCLPSIFNTAFLNEFTRVLKATNN